MSTLEKVIFIILGIYILAGGTIAVLDFTHILPLSTLLHFGVKQATVTPSPQQPAQQSQEFSLTQLTPVPSGDMFTQLVKPTGAVNALTVVTGHIADIAHADEDTYLTITKNDGTTVKEIASLIPQANIIIASTQGKESTATVSDLKKGDLVMVSYNQDSKSGKFVITGVRIMR